MACAVPKRWSKYTTVADCLISTRFVSRVSAKWWVVLWITVIFEPTFNVASLTNYWLNYWHTSCNKGASSFTYNTLLIRIQKCYWFKYLTQLIKTMRGKVKWNIPKQGFFKSSFQATIQIPDHHSNTRPFDNQTQIYHLNTWLVRYSDGYCT